MKATPETDLGGKTYLGWVEWSRKQETAEQMCYHVKLSFHLVHNVYILGEVT
jgi:hypothetical protein